LPPPTAPAHGQSEDARPAEKPSAAADARPLFVGRLQTSMLDRLQVVEKQMEQTLSRLDRLESRLQALGARVGGPEVGGTARPTASRPFMAPRNPRVP